MAEADHIQSNKIQAVELPQNTLDEPVHATIIRDFKRIGLKLWHVVIPGRVKSSAALRDWDLWGPLFLCLALAIILSATAPANDSALVFALVFVIVWCGAGVITLNAQLLGGNISFFQSVCFLGYCIFPITIAALICFLVGRFIDSIIIRSVVTLGGFIWSTVASVGFLSGMVPPPRKALAVYPVILFYLVLAWMVLLQRGKA